MSSPIRVATNRDANAVADLWTEAYVTLAGTGARLVDEMGRGRLIFRLVLER
jgi:hypothetical protein